MDGWLARLPRTAADGPSGDPSARLICVAISSGRQHSPDQDLEIEHQRPIVDVIEVVLHPLFHFLVRIGLTAVTVDLRPSGDSGLDVVPACIKRNASLVVPIVRQSMRTRPDEGHVALYDIEQLRQLVDAPAA